MNCAPFFLHGVKPVHATAWHTQVAFKQLYANKQITIWCVLSSHHTSHYSACYDGTLLMILLTFHIYTMLRLWAVARKPKRKKLIHHLNKKRVWYLSLRLLIHTQPMKESRVTAFTMACHLPNAGNDANRPHRSMGLMYAEIGHLHSKKASLLLKKTLFKNSQGLILNQSYNALTCMVCTLYQNKPFCASNWMCMK
jgi:hypothetical protein